MYSLSLSLSPCCFCRSRSIDTQTKSPVETFFLLLAGKNKDVSDVLKEEKKKHKHKTFPAFLRWLHPRQMQPICCVVLHLKDYDAIPFHSHHLHPRLQFGLVGEQTWSNKHGNTR